MAEDGSRTLTAAELVGNDTDPDLANTPATCCTWPRSPADSTPTAAWSLNGDGTVTYTPDADYAGPASFTYTVADAANTESANAAVVSLNVVNAMMRRPRSTTAPSMWPRTGHAP